MSDETDKETHFNNAVRENIVCLIFFILLYFAASGILSLFWYAQPFLNIYLDNEDLFVSKITFFISAFSIAICLASSILLPISIVSNEILIIYPENEYLNWLNTSLIHSIWNYIFLLSNCCLFIFLPFAYFFAESIGFRHIKRGLLNRFYETAIVCALFYTLIAGISWIIFLMIHSNQQIYYANKIWTYVWQHYVPFSYHCISLAGVVTLLVSTPFGFIKIFDVIESLGIKPQPFQNLEEQKEVAVVENIFLNQRILLEQSQQLFARQSSGSSILTKENYIQICQVEEVVCLRDLVKSYFLAQNSNIKSKILIQNSLNQNGIVSSANNKLIKDNLNLKVKSQFSIPFQRNLSNTKNNNNSVSEQQFHQISPDSNDFFSNFSIKSISKRRFSATSNNLRQRSTKIKAKLGTINTYLASPFWKRNVYYPIIISLLLVVTAVSVVLVLINCLELLFDEKAMPSFSKHFNIGHASLSFLGPFGASLQVISIIYLKVASLVGFIGIPLFAKIKPKLHATSYPKIIINCGLLIILTSAFPVFSRTLGLTNFDLIGHFGKLQWLGNFYLILSYNLIFVSVTIWCLFDKVTHNVRYELKNRILAHLFLIL